MTTVTRTLPVTAVIMTASGAGYAHAPMQGHGSMPMDPAAMQQMMQDSMPKPNDSASTKDFEEVDIAMMKNMHAPYTGDAAVDFRTHMIPHHQGATDIAKFALKHAKDPDTKKMAAAIIKDQEREIGEMWAWLKKHGH